jgi:hypothetical protein
MNELFGYKFQERKGKGRMKWEKASSTIFSRTVAVAARICV